jgi:transposase
MTSEKTGGRRRYSQELKAQILAQCDAPGASVAKVAMAHGINANVVHGWRKIAREGGGVVAAPVTPAFVPLMIESNREPVVPQTGEQPSVEIELRRGSVLMKLAWPTSAAADLAVWTRELLK